MIAVGRLAPSAKITGTHGTSREQRGRLSILFFIPRYPAIALFIIWLTVVSLLFVFDFPRRCHAADSDLVPVLVPVGYRKSPEMAENGGARK